VNKKPQSKPMNFAEVYYLKIEVNPFSVTFKGTNIGLFAKKPEDEKRC
jgi:hypothetical protein